MGVSSFSWRNVAVGAITGAITGGITAASGFKSIGAALEASKYGTAAAMAVGNAAAGYVGQKLAGVDVSFSWKNIAASTVANLVGAKVGNGNFKHDFTRDLATGLSSGAASVVVRKAYGFKDIDYGAVAVEAAASAIGSAAGRKLLTMGNTSNVRLADKTGDNRKLEAGKIDLSKAGSPGESFMAASFWDNSQPQHAWAYRPDMVRREDGYVVNRATGQVSARPMSQEAFDAKLMGFDDSINRFQKSYYSGASLRMTPYEFEQKRIGELDEALGMTVPESQDMETIVVRAKRAELPTPDVNQALVQVTCVRIL